ncbi:MAG TPA: SDR family oxidoreductase [candidate division Zixibacteria bacterium]|nr:SDR family oxidoreductase [candidate division Zixibacteria bacterium]
MRGLKDKRVMITGGAQGIGAATAERFLEEGARVAILDIDPIACQWIRSRLPNLETAVLADVANPEAVDEAFRTLDESFAGLDILINNAGISVQQPFLDITAEQWKRVVDVDLNGVFYVAQAAARRMLDQGGGVIINMGSTNALRGYPWYADYNAAKAGVISLTQTMALELAPTVRVVAVCPGYVMTPMQEAEYTPEMMQKLEQDIPLGRQANPEEIAGLFAFLASDDAAFITGSQIVIDGGEIIGTIAGKK